MRCILALECGIWCLILLECRCPFRNLTFDNQPAEFSTGSIQLLPENPDSAAEEAQEEGAPPPPPPPSGIPIAGVVALDYFGTEEVYELNHPLTLMPQDR